MTPVHLLTPTNNKVYTRNFNVKVGAGEGRTFIGGSGHLYPKNRLVHSLITKM